MLCDYDTIKIYLEQRGHQVDDPWDVVQIFENKVAEYAGSKYAIAVDSCTNAIFLCLKYLQATNPVIVPKNTYVSVPQTIIHAGCEVEFQDIEWEGVYQLNPYPIIDGATRFRRDMYVEDHYHCLSFHAKKILNIAKGGMILTNDIHAVKWIKLARYEGRDINVPYAKDKITTMGWNMYMPPEQAAVGILKIDLLPDVNDDCGSSKKYHDLSKLGCWGSK